MDQDTVTAAVRTLRMRGERISVRAVQLAHEAEVSALLKDIGHLERLYEARQADLRAARLAQTALQARAAELRWALPRVRQAHREAVHAAELRRRDLEHQVQLAERHVAATARALAAAEAELRQLTGEEGSR